MPAAIPASPAAPVRERAARLPCPASLAGGDTRLLARLEPEWLGPLLLLARRQLAADALTIAFRQAGYERLFLCTSEDRVREARGSLTLGLIGRGVSGLRGGRGILQAVECTELFGFAPSNYLGVPLRGGGGRLGGGVAAWSRRSRRWSVAEGSVLRKLAAACTDPLYDVTRGSDLHPLV